MAEIKFAINVLAIQSTTLEGQTFKAVESDIGRGLSGGDSDATWAGNSVSGWSAGVHTEITSGGGTVVGASSDGVWIKHTGFDFADGTTANTANVILTAGSVQIAKLAPGQAVFLPFCNTTITLSDDGTPAAVEYAVLT